MVRKISMYKVIKCSERSHRKAIAAGAVLMAASAMAGASENATNDWQYGFKIYAWLPTISGDMRYDFPNTGGEVEVDVDKILDALHMTFMGSFEVRKGNWAGFTDVLYVDLEGDNTKSVGLPDGDSVDLFDADMEIEAWVWTLGGSYTAWQNQGGYLDLLAGARMMSMDTTLKLEGTGPLQANHKLTESVELWDGIVGAKGRIKLSEQWFLPYYGDIGTGDSDLTWQLSGGVGYSFGWGDVTVEYRHLEYDQADDKPMQEVALSGAMLGAVFRF